MKILRKFDCSKTSNYWKNQNPPTNLTKQFVDPYFPPNNNSLLGLDQYGNMIDPIYGPLRVKEINPKEIEWKSVPEIFGEKFLMFENKIEFNDIKQGNLGNCYFLSAIAALTEYPLLIYQIFRSKDVNKFGYYEVLLYIDGEWQIVIVDDYFPVIKGTTDLKFCRPNGNELWAMILEKAWAKINGGYSLIIAGWPSDPLVALTGFDSMKIIHPEETEESIWQTIVNSDKENSIMCTNTIRNKEIEKMGLVLNHAYTLISAKETPDNTVRLLRIRNPWGYKEWSGKYSDKSELWTQELKEFFDELDKDDGTFYISIEDFAKYFGKTHICHIMYNSNCRFFYLKDELLHTPLFFIINIDQDEKCGFSLIFKHWRYNRNFIGAIHPASIVVAKLNEEDGKFTIFDFNGEYSSIDNVQYIQNLSKGTYLVWVYVDVENCYPYPEKVIFRINSPCKYKVSYYGTDYDFSILRKIFIEGLKHINKDKFNCSQDVVKFIENNFRRTGFGYQMLMNKYNNKTLFIECDMTKLEGLKVLPPYNTNNGKIQIVLKPNASTIILAFRTNQESHWMNVRKEIHEIEEKNEYIALEQDLEKDNLKIVIERQINPVVDPSFYDYLSLSKEEITMKTLTFETINMKEATLLRYKEEYKEYFDYILHLDPIENEYDLIWSKIDYKNGFYIGEVYEAKRHGRGAFLFNDGNYYMGYWQNNQRNNFGKIFNSNKKLIYKGGIHNGLKKGIGIQYFENGGRYEGEFDNDMKHGKGVYYFPNGTRWEGLFFNNQLNGEGFLYSSDNSIKKLTKYEDGKLV